jgi:hypothetical protein
MKYIIKYQNFFEAKGISDSCENILMKIWNKVEENIDGSELNFDISEVDFKCQSVKLIIGSKRGVENHCNGLTNFNQSHFQNDILINPIIKLDLEIFEINDEFIYYIKSVLLHELLHLFQYYNLGIKNKFRPEFFSIGSVIHQLRSNVKTKYANYILDIIYHSLSHELSAQLHQYYLYKKVNNNYTKIDDIRKLLNFQIQDLDLGENLEIDFIKKHILGSIRFFTKNEKYLKDIEKSIWLISDNNLFLKKLKIIVDDKIKWLDKKINLINRKIKEDRIIKYDETITCPQDWDQYDINIRYQFIIENLNDCPKIDNI